MITCQECIERLYPDDPRIPSGRYSQSSCDYFCDKPIYNREIENLPEKEPEPQWTAKQWDVIQQLRSEIVGWRQKHAEMMLELDKLLKKPKRKSKYT